jgi:hypothetical protein
LIKNRGNISNVEIAKKFGVARQQIWRDRQKIKQVAPIVLEDWDEEKEIEAALAHFDQLMVSASDELTVIDAEIANLWGTREAVDLRRARTSTMRECRQSLTDKLKFLMEIGYITAAPLRLEAAQPTDLSKLTDKDLDAEILRLDTMVQRSSVDESSSDTNGDTDEETSSA